MLINMQTITDEISKFLDNISTAVKYLKGISLATCLGHSKTSYSTEAIYVIKNRLYEILVPLSTFFINADKNMEIAKNIIPINALEIENKSISFIIVLFILKILKAIIENIKFKIKNANK